MEIKYADTFLESLKKLRMKNTWWWKTWDFLRYDAPRFFRNVWLFRKALWNYRWYSGDHAVMPFLREAINDIMEKKRVRGYEIESSSDKKIAKMKRAVFLLDHLIEEDFVELAENELGALYYDPFELEKSDCGNFYTKKDTLPPEEKAHNTKVYEKAREIEKMMWEELWEIVKGQDYSKFVIAEDDHDKRWEEWERQFDGSGMQGWWD
jgi:hypothetical protein